jgi:DNA-binding NarL/FixJ family response regulator
MDTMHAHGAALAAGRPDAPRKPSTVMIADRHAVYREALAAALNAHGDFRVVAEATDQLRVLSACTEIRPDILVLDIELLGLPQPQLLGQALCELRSASRDTRVLVVTMLDHPGLVNEVLRAGVGGYLHKSATGMEILAALVAIRFNTEQVVVSVPRSCLLHSGHSRGDTLSQRERQVLTLVAEAMSNRQIATRLHITEGTVKRHMRNIFGKLHAVSRIDAVNKAAAAVTASSALVANSAGN